MFSILSSSQPGRRCLGPCPGFAEITSCPAYVTSTWPQSFLNNFLHIRFFFFLSFWASLVAQTVKHLPAIRVTQVQSLSREDPLEKEMEIHSRILAWRIPWTEKPGRLQSMGLQRVGHD